MREAFEVSAVTGRARYGLHRKSRLPSALICAAGAVLLAGGLLFLVQLRSEFVSTKEPLAAAWEAGDFSAVYNLSGGVLEERPLDFLALTLRGFSAYELAAASGAEGAPFLDEAVWALRKALLLREAEKDGRLYYVLGKTYYYKGEAWADEAVSCLETALECGFEAEDIPEYLGLSYALTHDYWKSVEAFTRALSAGGGDGQDVSGLLLLNIARSYINLEDADSARAYLTRCLETSKDYVVKSKARLLLGGLLADAGDFSGSEAQYRAVLESDGESAEVRFQLGELYALKGDNVRARAEWRRARAIDGAYAPALARLRISM